MVSTRYDQYYKCAEYKSFLVVIVSFIDTRLIYFVCLKNNKGLRPSCLLRQNIKYSLVIKRTKVIIQFTLWISEADITDIRG